MRTVTWAKRSTRGLNQRPVSEPLLGQRLEQWRLDREGQPDRVRAGSDRTGVVVDVPLFDHGVELVDRVDLGDRDEVVAAKPADFSFDAALLVRALDARLTVEFVQVMFSEPNGPVLTWASPQGVPA